MSRPTDAERGARIAAGRASAMLNAEHSPLFPAKLKPAVRREWVSIAEAANEFLRECAALREARRAC